MLSTQEIVALARESHALQRVAELEQLVDIVREQPPRVVLEIGTFRGGTMRAWIECAASDATLIGVDMPGAEFGGGWTPDDYYRIRGLARLRQRVELIAGDSHDNAIREKVKTVLCGRAIDFLFIDGDHTYDGVKADFDTFTPLVASGGIVALHDVVPYPEVERCEVDRFWREHIVPGFAKRAQTIRTDGDYAGCGIGVIRWP